MNMSCPNYGSRHASFFADRCLCISQGGAIHNDNKAQTSTASIMFGICGSFVVDVIKAASADQS